MKFKTRHIAAVVVATTSAGFPGVGWADGGDAAALFGGMMLGSAIRANRDYEQQQAYAAGAYSQPRTVVVQQPAAAPAQPSAESRLRELEALHAKGLISDADLASRKKAIVDNI